MIGIRHLESLDWRADHESLRYHDLECLKGPGEHCVVRDGSLAEDVLPGLALEGPGSDGSGRTVPLADNYGLRAVPPRCGAQGCKDRGGSNSEQAHWQPPPLSRPEEQVEIEDDDLPRLPPGCPGLLDRRRTEHCSGDPGDAGSREGLSGNIVMNALPQVQGLSTGRFHPLLRSEGFPEGSDQSFVTNSAVAPQASDTMEFDGVHNGRQQVPFSPEVYLTQFRGGGEAAEDVPSRQRGAGVWSSSPSAEGQDPDMSRAESFPLSVATWNLAGAGKKKIKGIVTTVFEHDLMAVQEYPKQDAGWHVVDHGRMNAVLHQDLVMYRAVGVMYDKSKFRVRKRKKSTRGVWVLLEHLQSGRELWVGSLHLPVNEVVEERDRFTDEFLACLPATDKPALLLGDMNTHFTWGVEQGVAEPRSMHSKWSKLRQAAVERGFVQIAPRGDDIRAPTFVPRRAGASSTQIDGIFAARCHVAPVQVEKDSRHEIGTDHERVKAWVLLSGVRRDHQGVKHQAGGPRRVCSTPPPQREINEKTLQKLATRHTRPASLGVRFRMSARARELQRNAKIMKTAGAWKIYLGNLRREKDAWKAGRVEQAAADWGTFKQLCRSRKGWMEGFMVASQSDTPEQDVVKHFTDVFHDAEKPNTISTLLAWYTWQESGGWKCA